MFGALLKTLRAAPERGLPSPEAHLALAALLVRVARSDGLYAAEEAASIDRVLMAHLGIGPFEAARLRDAAEGLEADAPDTVRFTRALKAATPVEERTRLLEVLWSVALADGQRDAEEDQLLRVVAGLLGLTDVENALARQRAARDTRDTRDI